MAQKLLVDNYGSDLSVSPAQRPPKMIQEEPKGEVVVCGDSAFAESSTVQFDIVTDTIFDTFDDIYPTAMLAYKH